jgi:hypothetical protein
MRADPEQQPGVDVGEIGGHAASFTSLSWCGHDLVDVRNLKPETDGVSRPQPPPLGLARLGPGPCTATGRANKSHSTAASHTFRSLSGKVTVLALGIIGLNRRFFDRYRQAPTSASSTSVVLRGGVAARRSELWRRPLGATMSASGKWLFDIEGGARCCPAAGRGDAAAPAPDRRRPAVAAGTRGACPSPAGGRRTTSCLPPTSKLQHQHQRRCSLIPLGHRCLARNCIGVVPVQRLNARTSGAASE